MQRTQIILALGLATLELITPKSSLAFPIGNADFDLKLLCHMFKKYEVPVPKTLGASCCMDKYSEWCGEWSDKKDGFKWQKLPNLSGYASHDAFSDCLSTIKVMELMAGVHDPTAATAEEIDLDF